ncbi:MAG: guanylate kinase, partial [Gemmatimonadales bacterium]
MRPFLLVLSAPSGCGKTTIARRLLAERAGLAYSVSATTRPPRAGERDGQAYHFLTPEEFARRVKAGDFLEWAEYAGYRYGTLRADVDRI